MSNSLKVCPFCGGLAYLYKKKKSYSIECAVCGASIKSNSRKDLEIAWNRRVESSIDLSISKVIDLLTESRDILGLTVAELKEENRKLKEELAIARGKIE